MTGFLSLTGKRALVTAGTKGAGKATAALLHDLGATVLTASPTPPAEIRDRT